MAVTASPPLERPAALDRSLARLRRVLPWYAAGTLAILVLPGAWRYRAAPWSLPILVELQFWVWGSAFLVFALAITFAVRSPGGIRRRDWIVIALGAWSAGGLFLWLHPELAVSRAVAAVCLVMGIALAVLPYLWRGGLNGAAAVLTLASVLTLRIENRIATAAAASPAPLVRRLPTALTALTITSFPQVVDSSEVVGGAIEPFRDAFVLLTGEGEFYRLQWNPDGTMLGATRLAVTAPLERAAFFRQRQGKLPTLRLRANDFVLDTTASPARVYLSHEHWDPEHECVTMRVSVTTLPASTSTAVAVWSTLFDSAPCLGLTDEFDEAETGGRLAWIGPRSLLLTVGDHGHNGLSGTGAVSQDASNSYGKIIRLELDGRSAIYSLGHRNPQGLEIDRDGRIWSTEHGPQGGDEINLIRRGANYGWPRVTYGTQYGLDRWPLDSGARDHGDFEEPVRSFASSLGISNLIQLGGKQFPAWDGDLLVGSLRARTLFRIRTRGDRIVSEEPIALGRRTRDLAEGSDGRILIWNGVRDIIVLSRAAPDEGEQAYAPCSQCHGADLAGTPTGPSLRHVYDRRIAASAGFNYSPALRALGGAWNDDRLDLFLTDPGAYAPGTAMSMPGIRDAGTRRALIDYLHRNY